MPKLLYFIPCDRVIVSREETLSLITLLENVNIDIPAERQANLPVDAVIPFTWHAVAFWLFDEAEVEHQYEQRVQLVLPDGRITTNLITAITHEEGKSNHKIIVQIDGFPVTLTGTCDLKLSYREVGEGNEFIDVASYPINVVRLDQAE